MQRQPILLFWVGAVLAGTIAHRVPAAEPASTNSAAGRVLLNGALGQTVAVPTNAVPANLLPPPSIGLEYQVPQPARGTQVPEANPKGIVALSPGLRAARYPGCHVRGYQP
jgi:hypothetical protein